MSNTKSNKRLTTEEFIARARAVHGDWYGYDEVEYQAMRVPVTIICPEHGAFQQQPVEHLHGSGCPRCAQSQRARKRRMSQEDFVARCRDVHGDKYDYSRAQYVNKNTKVEIICPEHGSFWQLPSNHWKGQGCPKCAGRMRANGESGFLKRCREVHGDKYDYSQVEYKGGRIPVTIICPEHGSFLQTPERHLEGRGCPKCGQMRAQASRAKRVASVAVSVRPKLASPQPIKPVKRLTKPQVSKRPVGRPRKDTMREPWRVQRHIVMTRVKNAKLSAGSLSVANAKETAYAILVDVFGVNDVQRDYTDVVRQFTCDFHIASRDLFIDFYAVSEHGGHWFNANDAEDVVRLSALSDADDASVIDVWTVKDLAHRAAAKRHGLNYVVFWDVRLRDLMVWIAYGCPNAHDYERVWSWFDPLEKLTLMMPSTLTGATAVSRAVRAAQQDVYFADEKALWADSSLGITRRGTHMSPRMILLANRYAYAEKAVPDLTPSDILRGFKIAGMVHGYTVFNTKLMRSVIDTHHITSVADPCAGWGERALTCAQLGIAYEGVDVNAALEPGYTRMLDAFGTGAQTFAVDAGELHAFHEADAVITCPPYMNQEIYSDAGAENLESEAFAAWWVSVVDNCVATANPRLFCVQTNQKCREVFKQGVEQAGYTLVDELVLGSQSSHFTRARGGVNRKREFESMLVFECR